MNDKLKTAIYGFAVGDALGAPYEFTIRKRSRTRNVDHFRRFRIRLYYE